MTTEVETKDKQEDWLQKRWRPLMAGMYLIVCTCDFVIFPVLWGILQTVGGGRVETQWSPITLQGAGLFHMAMGAILGIAAWGRTQEKMAGTTITSTSSFGGPPASFGPAPTNCQTAAPTPPSFTPAPPPSFGAKPTGPGRASMPEL